MLLAMKKTYPPNQPVIELGLPPFVEIPIPDISKVMRDSNHSHWIFFILLFKPEKQQILF